MRRLGKENGVPKLNIVIIDRIPHSKGVLLSCDKEGKLVKILFLTHAMDRMTKWKLTPEIVVETLLAPEEVLVGHHKRFIAHRRYGEHISRAIYEYDNLIPSLVTVYFPYKDRYYQGGGYFEDKILE